LRAGIFLPASVARACFRRISFARVLPASVFRRGGGMMDERFLFRSARCVGTLNLGPTPADVAGNLLLAERGIRTAKTLHPELRWLVLPELFTCGYSDLASVQRHAEDAHDGPSARLFASLAAELGLHVVYGFPERVPGEFATARTSSDRRVCC